MKNPLRIWKFILLDWPQYSDIDSDFYYGSYSIKEMDSYSYDAFLIHQISEDTEDIPDQIKKQLEDIISIEERIKYINDIEREIDNLCELAHKINYEQDAYKFAVKELKSLRYHIYDSFETLRLGLTNELKKGPGEKKLKIDASRRDIVHFFLLLMDSGYLKYISDYELSVFIQNTFCYKKGAGYSDLRGIRSYIYNIRTTGQYSKDAVNFIKTMFKDKNLKDFK